MPTTPEGFTQLREILRDYLGCPDEPQTWTFVTGQITSQPSASVHIRFSSIVNGVRRLRINELAQRLLKEPAMNELRARFAAAAEKLAKETPNAPNQSPEAELTPSDGQPDQTPRQVYPELGQEEG